MGSFDHRSILVGFNDEQLQAACSQDLITLGRVRRVLRRAQRSWIITGAWHYQGESIYEAAEVIPESIYRGCRCDYSTRSADLMNLYLSIDEAADPVARGERRRDESLLRKYFYAGMPVHCHGTDYRIGTRTQRWRASCSLSLF